MQKEYVRDFHVKKNYARDFDERTIQRHIEEAEYKIFISRQTIQQLKKDLIFYYVAFIWFIALLWIGRNVFYFQLCIVVMATFMFLSKKLSFMSEKYFYYIGFMLCVYFVVRFLGIFRIAVGAVVIDLSLFIVFVCAAYVAFQTLRFVILTIPALKSVSAFFGRYNLGAIVLENQDKVCRLKSELEYRKKMDLENSLLDDAKQQPR